MSRYSPDAYTQLFPQGPKSAGRPLLPEDNKDHYSADPHFFEWWYVDVAFTDGSWLVAVLHSAAYNTGDNKPIVDLRYYPSDGSAPVIVMERFSRSEYEVACNCFKVRIGKSWLEDIENGDYHLHLCQGPLEADLTFHSGLSGWRAGSGHLFSDSSNGKYFDWVIPMPSASVKGTLRVQGENHAVTGMGYHDHNWGNIYFRSVFKNWTWGRVWGENNTMVFADLVPQGNAPRITPLLLGCDGNVREIPYGFELRKEYVTRDTRIDAVELRNLSLGTDKRSDVSLTLNVLKPMETAQISALRSCLVPLRRIAEPLSCLTRRVPVFGKVLGALFGTGMYRRWPVEGHLRITNKEIKVQGLVEEMELEPYGKG